MRYDDAHIQRLPAAGYRRTRWKNGAGWTHEILCVPAHADRWDWRLSIAHIDQDGPFSLFPEVERELMLLTGQGLRLRFEHGTLHHLLPPFASLRFSGEQAVSGELVDGPTTDFNLMWRRTSVAAASWRLQLAGVMELLVEPGHHLVVHVLAGQVRRVWTSADAPPHGAGAMTVMDTAVITAAGKARSRCVVEGVAELLLIRVVPVRPAEAGMIEAGGD